MPLLTSVAVYEVRQSSKTKDCSAPAVTKQIMAACYDLPSVTLLPSSVVPFLFFFLFQKTGTKVSQNCILIPENWDRRFPYFNSSFFGNWDKDMGKSGHKFPERGTNVPENWDGIHFLLSIRYNFQFLFRGRLRSSAGLPMLGSLRL